MAKLLTHNDNFKLCKNNIGIKFAFYKTNALKTADDFNSFCISNAATAAYNNYKQGNYATALAMLELIDAKQLNPIQLRNLNHLKEQCKLFIL